MRAPNITPATNLNSVIEQMDKILDWAVTVGSRLGFFPALYRKVTLKVRDGIPIGAFEDGDRMERLVVVFANRYFAAFEQYHTGQITTRSWQIAFDAAKDSRYLILQHLFLGINAHINLDLGIAAADISTSDNIDHLKTDFERINLILTNLIDETQDRVGAFSPWLVLLDKIGERADEKFAAFSLKIARQEAWRNAKRFAGMEKDALAVEIRQLDHTVSEIAHLIGRNGPIARFLIWIIQWRERKDVTAVIKGLQ